MVEWLYLPASGGEGERLINTATIVFLVFLEDTDNGVPQSQTWTGRIEVDSTRTRRTAEASNHRPIAVTSMPSASVSPRIGSRSALMRLYIEG